MEEEVAQAGDAGGVDAALRLDDVARRLGHLALVGQPVARAALRQPPAGAGDGDEDDIINYC